MLLRNSLLLTLAALPALAADWSPQLAAQYLDSRQKLWLAWPYANRTGVPCISCHTGIPFLLSRAALRRELRETVPTPYETALVNGARAKATAEITGTQAVLAPLILAFDDAQAGRGMSPEAEQAFDRLWQTQIRTGLSKGAWQWTTVDLDPWETTDSVFYGATLAALAVGSAPDDYQSRPKIRENIAMLVAYLRDLQSRQPLHNRLALVWASRQLRDCLSDAEQSAILDEVRRKQGADGGWSLESLGAWMKHENAPPQPGSNAYATAAVAFMLERASVPPKDQSLARALKWLRTRQDPKGYWDAQSMNKRYESGSMQLEFMRDAATGYATAALLHGVR